MIDKIPSSEKKILKIVLEYTSELRTSISIAYILACMCVCNVYECASVCFNLLNLRANEWCFMWYFQVFNIKLKSSEWTKFDLKSRFVVKKSISPSLSFLFQYKISKNISNFSKCTVTIKHIISRKNAFYSLKRNGCFKHFQFSVHCSFIYVFDCSILESCEYWKSKSSMNLCVWISASCHLEMHSENVLQQ